MNELLNTPLSERELEILKLVAQGKANKEIAVELFISVNTVKVHLAKIFQRIGVASRTEATLYAIKHEHVENPNHSLVNPQDQQVESRVELVVPETVTVERALVKRSVADIIRKFWWAFGIGFLVLASFTVAWDRGWIFPKPTPDPILAAMNEDRWKELAPMSVARANMAVTVYDNKIYVIGGETEEGVTGLTEVYDIATDTWARLPDKPTPVTNAKAVAVGGKIYVPGGKDVSGNSTNVNEFFDSQRQLWIVDSPLPLPLNAYALSSYEGEIYIFGGESDGVSTDSVMLLDPNSHKTIELPNLSSRKKDLSVINQGTDILVVGGINEAGNLPSIDVFNPVEKLFSNTSELDIGRILKACPDCTTFNLSEFVYILQSDGFWQYKSDQGSWVRVSEVLEGYDLSKQIPFGLTNTDAYLFPIGKGNKLDNKLFSIRLVYILSLPGIIKP
jgi:DNA-binding CsgD family transcriptional regulator